MANNKIYIAAAGSGKTTFILKEAIDLYRSGMLNNKKILIVTYTKNNQDNITKKVTEKFGCVPQNITICGWFTFLLDYWVRPFKGTVIEQLFDRHVELFYVDGISGKKKLKNGRYISKYNKGNDQEKFLTGNGCEIYSDKLAEFAVECYNKNKNDLLLRFSNIVHTIFVDELQDLAAYDYEIMKILFKCGTVNCILCGDPRQTTYITSNANKYKGYKGDFESFVQKEVNTLKKKYVDIDKTTLAQSHRCSEDICEFASKIMEQYHPMKMCTCDSCSQRRDGYNLPQGIFYVKEKDVKDFVDLYDPLSLVWDRDTNPIVQTKMHMNWGESKGLEADATLIYLTVNLRNDFFEKAKNVNKISSIRMSKFYVAVTRAKYVIGIVIPDDSPNLQINLPFWGEVKTAVVSR